MIVKFLLLGAVDAMHGHLNSDIYCKWYGTVSFNRLMIRPLLVSVTFTNKSTVVPGHTWGDYMHSIMDDSTQQWLHHS